MKASFQSEFGLPTEHLSQSVLDELYGCYEIARDYAQQRDKDHGLDGKESGVVNRNPSSDVWRLIESITEDNTSP